MREVGFKEASELLSTPVSTLRRWMGLLEAAGYEVQREGKRRQLSWLVVGVLREVALLTQEHPLEKAVHLAVTAAQKEVEAGNASNDEQDSNGPRTTLQDPGQNERFWQKLQQLPQTIYWLGVEQAVAELRDLYGQQEEENNT
ncbi:hypothetical protein [Paenibacillus graminis]|uniref:hypothetical protein n=1 Tax=Paenibacillus graminis TaxID=189425 RepID=UPI002DB65607|nr:hypothetical protein [Paenibacillus graminis]MEC0167376.1 hypothetical protein [Paenibacillus graminis]